MKLILCLLALLVAACAATAADFTKEEAQKYLSLYDEEQAVTAKLEAGNLPAAEHAQLAARQIELEDSLGTIERAVEQRKNQGIIGAIGSVLGPGGELIAGAIGMGLAPLLGPRGRRHAANLIRSAAPFTNRSSKNLASDLAKYIGAVHTDPLPATVTTG